MNSKRLSPRTTRWVVGVAAGATVAAMCVPATGAEVVVDDRCLGRARHRGCWSEAAAWTVAGGVTPGPTRCRRTTTAGTRPRRTRVRCSRWGRRSGPQGVDEEGPDRASADRAGRRRCSAGLRGRPGGRFERRRQSDPWPGSVDRGQRCADPARHLRPRHLHGRHHRRQGNHEPLLGSSHRAGERAARSRAGREAPGHRSWRPRMAASTCPKRSPRWTG